MKQSRFTLIELLAVIAIILILMAMLFPAFRSARDRVSAVACSGNLRQIGMFIAAYASNNDDLLARLIYHPDSGKLLARGTESPVFFSGVFEALEYDQKGVLEQDADGLPRVTHKSFICPRTPQARVSQKEAVEHLWKSYNTYWFATWGLNPNDNYSPYPSPYHYSRVVRPHTKAAVQDGRRVMNLNNDIKYYPVLKGGAYIPGAGRAGMIWGGSMADKHGPQEYGELHGFKKDFLYGRHGLPLNILFFDGHVETLSPRGKVTEDFHRREYNSPNNMFNRQKE